MNGLLSKHTPRKSTAMKYSLHLLIMVSELEKELRSWLLSIKQFNREVISGSSGQMIDTTSQTLKILLGFYSQLIKLWHVINFRLSSSVLVKRSLD